MKVDVIDYPIEADWIRCKEVALVTMGKKWNSLHTRTNLEWKKAILRARHSPIRILQYTILVEDIPYFLTMHIVRHKVGFECFVSTQRNDRQDEFDREEAPQNNPVDMVIYCNAEALITFFQKRLCRKAHEANKKPGRIGMDDVAYAIREAVLEVTPELEEMAVPPCALYNRCMEMIPCGRLNEDGV